jgi:hypothetical protein
VHPQVIAILFYYWCKKTNYWKKIVFFLNYLFDPRIGFYGPKIGLEIVFSGSLVHSVYVHDPQWSSGRTKAKNGPAQYVRWAETAQNGHLVDFFFVSAQNGDFFQPSNTTARRRYNCQMETKIHAQTKKFSTRSWNFLSIIIRFEK